MAEENGPIIRFETVYVSRTPFADARVQELSYWCQKFHETGLAPTVGGSSAGNLSFRIFPGKNEILVTASALELKTGLTSECFVRIESIDYSTNKVYVHGVRPPSSECMMHYMIAESCPHVGAVFHGHSSEILASAARLGIPVTEKEDLPGSTDLAKAVAAIAGNTESLIMKDHGFVCLGKDMAEAGAHALNLLSASSPQ